jgi:hypothetical protein
MNTILLEPLLYLAAICSVVSYSFVRYYVITPFNVSLIIYAIVIEMVVVYCYYGLLQKKCSSEIVFSLIKILSVLIGFIYGFCVFGDKITAKTVMGLIFAILAIYLLA